ncbi:MAG: Spermidine synthase [bacterium ADurb.Bin243]|nr:MAG: Spermidine synthase [bacterium ADurb.Bin243]HOD39170.1 hypothetical protein [Candidatus Wallbacteria bacterium]
MSRKNIYASIYLVSLSLLMYEVLLTRIFSVTMYYHFAFLIVSIAMFGITAGSLSVYLFSDFFARRDTLYNISLASLFQALTIILSFAAHQNVEPFFTTRSLNAWWFVSAFFVCALIAVPFAFGGVAISLALQKYSQEAGKIYAFDLMGAACGCVAFVFCIDFAGGPTCVIIAAFFAAAASYLCGGFNDAPNLRRAVILCAVLMLAFAGVNKKTNYFGLHLVKGEIEENVIFEKWNSFSRVTVAGDPAAPKKPFGWGISPAYPVAQKRVKQLMLFIDALAGTPLTCFKGDTSELEFLKYDIINFAHHIKTGGRVLVIGAGGGRDILSALVFGQKTIAAAEINGDIIKAVNGIFGDFTGHLDKIEGVSFVNDEARSFIAREEEERYDVIQVSLVDTWAATSSGAFVLSENSLYTKEAWKLFLKRLTPEGMITFSRWYYPGNPGEIYRLASLAAESLAESGAGDPGPRVFILKSGGGKEDDGIGTIIVRKEPFGPDEIKLVSRKAEELGFDIVAGPDTRKDDNLNKILAPAGRSEFISKFPIDISAPTDDRPFFFNMLRFSSVFDAAAVQQGIVGTANMKAVKVLAALLIIVFILTLVCVFIPLALRGSKRPGRDSLPLIFYFSSLGAGFMLVEIALMQRLNTFLGHPVYGLLVVLFTLLVAGGLGSGFSAYIKPAAEARHIKKILLAIIFIIAPLSFLTAGITEAAGGAQNYTRIAAAALMVFIPGFFMGMPFPMGLKFASNGHRALIPWFFGANGAFSVLFSVAAVAVSLAFGITASFALGCFFYAAALASIAAAAGANEGAK